MVKTTPQLQLGGTTTKEKGDEEPFKQVQAVWSTRFDFPAI